MRQDALADRGVEASRESGPAAFCQMSSGAARGSGGRSPSTGSGAGSSGRRSSSPPPALPFATTSPPPRVTSTPLPLLPVVSRFSAPSSFSPRRRSSPLPGSCGPMRGVLSAAGRKEDESAASGEETTGSEEIIMSWVVFSARGRRFFPDGGGGSSRGKESKEEKLLEERGNGEPLLATEGRRVDGAGPQVVIGRCRGAPGGVLARPRGLRTLLLGDGVLKHTLINCEKRKKKDR
ncbi:hypothetical protein EYF80_012903 [Liparis tanakae]|uniref:Uncharacterized protein n=1 Tax=Liparis tanakae TaxID=230148 RepID=A0A4Z2IFZ4_9TELE|nr:hypothetical protein EYF80_012903 [Liparis tanakae]